MNEERWKRRNASRGKRGVYSTRFMLLLLLLLVWLYRRDNTLSSLWDRDLQSTGYRDLLNQHIDVGSRYRKRSAVRDAYPIFLAVFFLFPLIFFSRERGQKNKKRQSFRCSFVFLSFLLFLLFFFSSLAESEQTDNNNKTTDCRDREEREKKREEKKKSIECSYEFILLLLLLLSVSWPLRRTSNSLEMSFLDLSREKGEERRRGERKGEKRV